jgi:hypothetical protein
LILLVFLYELLPLLELKLHVEKKLKLGTFDIRICQKAQAQLVAKTGHAKNSLLARLKKPLLANVCNIQDK